MHHRVALAIALITVIPLSPCLAGEFGQTVQYFAQYGIGGPAETAFTIHDPGNAAILVAVELINSDGSLFQMEEVAVGPGAAETVVFSDPKGEIRNGWARLTSDAPFSATIFFRIAGFGNVGVLPSEQGVKFKLFSFVGEGTDTGFAVANTSKTQSSTVTARIFSAAGVFQREEQETYGPGEHEALFVTQEPLLVEADSVVEFTATQPVIILGLRSDNNLLASTAVIQPEGGGLEPGSIGTEHLANGAVTGSKIADDTVVRSLNGLTDDVSLAAGDNVTLTPNGQTLTIAAIDGLDGPQGDPGPQGPQGPPGQDGQDFTLPFDGEVSTNASALSIRNTGTGGAATFLSNNPSHTLRIQNNGGPGLAVTGNSFNQPTLTATNTSGGSCAVFGGNVGIGTLAPSTRLHVLDTVSSGHITIIENRNSGSNADVLELKLTNRPTPTGGNNYLSFRRGDGLFAGQIDGNGIGGVSYKSTGSDFAEWLPRLDSQERIEAGDIVGVFEGRISRKTAGANQIMVISTAPIVLGNSPPESEEHLYEKVAFVGQAPVKVRGPVKAGDYIVPSRLNDGTGVAISAPEMKLSDFGRIVGRAWESSDREEVKLIKAVVGLAHPAPDLVALLAQKDEQLKTLSAEVELLKLNQQRLMRHLMSADTE